MFLEWRDDLAKTSLRQADYAYGTLARILSWALKRGLIDVNPCAEGGKLYSGTRVDKVWSDERDRPVPRRRAAGPAPGRCCWRSTPASARATCASSPGRPMTGRSSNPPAQDRRLCPDSGVRRAQGRARRRAADKPDHAGEQRRQAVVGIRLPERLGQGDGASRDRGPHLPRLARHRRRRRSRGPAATWSRSIRSPATSPATCRRS